MEYKPHKYQEYATQKIIDSKASALFLDCGLGKTVITLTAIRRLKYERWEARKVLIIAPKTVAEDTWQSEAQKWDHLRGLRFSTVLGTAAQRKAALAARADIYVINRENTAWLVKELGHKWDFDTVVLDESTSFKSHQSQRFKAMKAVRPRVRRIIELTGTPDPHGLMDLWAEIYLLDRGERLGRTIGAYREQWFRPALQNGFVVYKWAPVRGAEEQIRERISDICVSMSAADYLELPDRIDREIPVKLSDDEMQQYRLLERTQILQLESGEVVAALNAAAVMTKLLQLSNGSAYADDGSVVRIHERKLDALEEIVDTTDGPVLVFYSFRHDLQAIKDRIPEARELSGPDDISAWNRGEIRVLLAHPASVGYGLNLQDGGHVIVWYGLTWSLELYQQANARLHRQGQTRPVIIHHLIAEGTVDEQVMRALKAKDTGQAALLAALKERSRG